MVGLPGVKDASIFNGRMEQDAKTEIKKPWYACLLTSQQFAAQHHKS
jgi:hypothetical protein